MYGFVNGQGNDFCDACFTGNYPVALSDDTKVRQLHLFEASDR
jgi:glutamine phosphoribosylpyrophosphate amidotransferase